MADGNAMVAGRSLDEWSERLFPDVSMRVTDAYDEDSPYSRMVQVAITNRQESRRVASLKSLSRDANDEDSPHYRMVQVRMFNYRLMRNACNVSAAVVDARKKSSCESQQFLSQGWSEAYCNT